MSNKIYKTCHIILNVKKIHRFKWIKFTIYLCETLYREDESELLPYRAVGGFLHVNNLWIFQHASYHWEVWRSGEIQKIKDEHTDTLQMIIIKCNEIAQSENNPKLWYRKLRVGHRNYMDWISHLFCQYPSLWIIMLICLIFSNLFMCFGFISLSTFTSNSQLILWRHSFYLGTEEKHSICEARHKYSFPNF